MLPGPVSSEMPPVHFVLVAQSILCQNADLAEDALVGAPGRHPSLDNGHVGLLTLPFPSPLPSPKPPKQTVLGYLQHMHSYTQSLHNIALALIHSPPPPDQCEPLLWVRPHARRQSTGSQQATCCGWSHGPCPPIHGSLFSAPPPPCPGTLSEYSLLVCQ